MLVAFLDFLAFVVYPELSRRIRGTTDKGLKSAAIKPTAVFVAAGNSVTLNKIEVWREGNFGINAEVTAARKDLLDFTTKVAEIELKKLKKGWEFNMPEGFSKKRDVNIRQILEFIGSCNKNMILGKPLPVQKSGCIFLCLFYCVCDKFDELLRQSLS